jgi:hypothetical protein
MSLSSFKGPSYAELTDPQAIAQNAQGAITARQAALVREAVGIQRSAVFTGLVGLILFGAMGLFTFYNMSAMFSRPAISIPTVWLPMLIFAVIFVVVELGFLISVLRAWGDLRTTLGELRSGRVAQADGEVRWGRGRYLVRSYVAYVGRRSLRSTGYALQLSPGPYRCYFLPKSGWLLAAQPSAASGPTTPLMGAARPPHVSIMAEHGFTAADLQANRAGQLSGRQRRALIGALIGWLVLTLAVILIALLLLFTAANGLILAIIGGLGALIPAYKTVQCLADLSAGQPIMVAEGQLITEFAHAYRSINVFYRLGNSKFELSNRMIYRQAYATLIEGRRYRMYGLARTKLVLSLEET